MKTFHYEHRGQPLLPRAHFVQRILVHFAFAIALVAESLVIGMVGYVYFEQMSWIDAFVNAAMLLGGMGPVNPLTTTAGKLFAGCYALFAGLVFLIVAGVLLGPVFHRVLHRFHLDERI
jgi:hypothetical protein